MINYIIIIFLIKPIKSDQMINLKKLHHTQCRTSKKFIFFFNIWIKKYKHFIYIQSNFINICIQKKQYFIVHLYTVKFSEWEAHSLQQHLLYIYVLSYLVCKGLCKECKEVSKNCISWLTIKNIDKNEMIKEA